MYPDSCSLKRMPWTFFGLSAIDVASTSMIANLVFGNCFATWSTASVIRKPTAITRP